MSKNEKINEPEAGVNRENLEKQNLDIEIHLANNRIRLQVARLISAGFGFIILLLGGFFSIWFAGAVGGPLKWGILRFSTIVAIYLLVFPIRINIIRERDDQHFRKILENNNELLTMHKSYLQSKKKYL